LKCFPLDESSAPPFAAPFDDFGAPDDGDFFDLVDAGLDVFFLVLVGFYHIGGVCESERDT
jgi:hypothetical protein